MHGACVTQLDGVVEPLFALLKLTFRNLNKKHDFAGKFGLSETQFLRNIFSHMNLGELDSRIGDSLRSKSDPNLAIPAVREGDDG